MVNEKQEILAEKIAGVLGWPKGESIKWLSPIRENKYAEYYDQAFLDQLGLPHLRVPLASFWPSSGPRWDALGRTESDKMILVEAKAYIEESVDHSSRASHEESVAQIKKSLAKA